MGLFDYGRKKNKVDVPNEVKTETADDEKYVLRTAEEALKMTEAKRKEIKERQEEEGRKKLAEFTNSDEFKRLMRFINKRISFGYDHIIAYGYDYFVLKSNIICVCIQGTAVLIEEQQIYDIKVKMKMSF